MGALGNKEIMARNIRLYMSRDGISRRDLCAALDVPYTTVTDWLKAKTYPRIDKIEAMSRHFGITKADLVEEKPAGNDELEEEFMGYFRNITSKQREEIIKELRSMQLDE